MAKILLGRTLDSTTDSATVEQGATSTPWSVTHDGPITIDVDPAALPLPVVQALTVDVDQVAGASPWSVLATNTLVPAEFDHIQLGYTASQMTSVIYKTGGAAGTTVATLALTYDVDSNIETVTRT